VSWVRPARRGSSAVGAAGQGEPAYAALVGPLLAYLRQRTPILASKNALSLAPRQRDHGRLGALPATRRSPRLPRSPVIMPTVSPAATRADQPRYPPARPAVGIIARSA
jgi:hypothetical protein